MYKRQVYTAEENGEYIVRIEDADGKTERKAKVGAETEYGMVSLLFDAFCAHTGKMPRWGMLTGIHPIKPVSYTHLDVYKRQVRDHSGV